MALVVVAGIAPGTFAQGPTLAARIFVTGQANHPMRLPAGTYIDSATRFDDDHVRVNSGPHSYISDGQAITPVMVAGEQVPGQAPGVVWGETRHNITQAWPVDGLGTAFRASVRGPGFGDTPRTVGVAGDLLAGQLSLSPNYVAVTRTGRGAGFADDGLRTGPIFGPTQLIIPAGYVPPGFTGQMFLDDVQPRISPNGAVAAQYTGTYSNIGFTDVILTVQDGQIRTLAIGASVNTDRGLFTLRRNLTLCSAPSSDGAVVVMGQYSAAGQLNSILWNAESSGRNTVIAATGDRAPGTEHGVTFATFQSVGSNQRGSFLFFTTLQGPGVSTQTRNAYYLWRNHRLTLVARSSADADIYGFPYGAATLNQNDQVGIIAERSLIFTPGIGSVTVAQINQPLNAGFGISGVAEQVSSFFGISIENNRAGGDEAKMPFLSHDGELFLCINASVSGPSVLAVRVLTPPCPADFNTDGFTDFFDYADFVECFEGGRCPDGRTPDFNNDDYADFFDYSDFITAFESPC